MSTPVPKGKDASTHTGRVLVWAIGRLRGYWLALMGGLRQEPSLHRKCGVEPPCLVSFVRSTSMLDITGIAGDVASTGDQPFMVASHAGRRLTEWLPLLVDPPVSDE